MKLADFINENNTFFLEESSKIDILNELINKAFGLSYISDIDKFKIAIQEREIQKSTGIGDGVAIPHATIEGVSQPFIITALLKSPVGWNSLDNQPVKLVFLIGIPNDKYDVYLQILSSLMRMVKDKEKRDKIFNVHAIEEFIGFVC